MNPSSSDLVTRWLRDQTGRRHAALAGRASAALWATLRARDMHGQTVLMPANVCYIVAWAVLQSGNRPCLVDIDSATGNISLETLSAVRVEAPAALIVCHMYGLGAPIAALVEWAQQRGIFVIEDAALALGAMVDGRPAGSWGDVSLFSFGAGKIVDAGNGGAIVCDEAELARRIRSELDTLPLWSQRIEQLWDQWSELYWLLHQSEQTNPALATVYASFFRIYSEITAYQLPTSHWDGLAPSLAALESNLRHRREMADLYDEHFRSAPVRTLARPAGHSVWQYPVLVARQERDALLSELWENNILASSWYPSLRPMLATLNPAIEKQSTPGADELGAEIINLPVDHTADGEAVERSAQIVQTYFQRQRRAVI